MKTALIFCILCTGCATMQAVIDALPDPTPQEKCQSQHGSWDQVTTYDANNNPTVSYQCTVKS